MSFPNVIHGSESETFNTYTVEKVPVGTKMVIEDGRTFRFVENGAVAAVCGTLFQSIVPSANFLAEAVGALAAGVSVLTGVGATTGGAAADLFKEGYLWVDTAAQLDAIHKVKSNTAIVHTADTGTITLYTPLKDAIAGAETISYIENPYRDIIIHLSPPTAPLVGVIVTAISANEYGWVATGGPTKVLVDGTLVAGDQVVASDSVNGSVETLNFTLSEGAPNTLDGVQSQQAVGVVMEIGTDTLYGLVNLQLDA